VKKWKIKTKRERDRQLEKNIYDDRRRKRKHIYRRTHRTTTVTTAKSF
jgi:hypothetical protein